MLISLVTSGGYWVRTGAESDSAVLAARPRRGTNGLPLPEELFEVDNARHSVDTLSQGDTIYLRDAMGRYLTAEDHGGGRLVAGVAGATRAGQDSTFAIRIMDGSENVGDGTRVALRTTGRRRYFIVAEHGGGDVVDVNREDAQEWETFLWIVAKEHPEERPDDQSAPSWWIQPRIRKGTVSTLVALVEYSDMPAPIDDSVTVESIRDVVFGYVPGPSVDTFYPRDSILHWLARNSYRDLTLSEYLIAPVKLPRRFDWYWKGERRLTQYWQHIVDRLDLPDRNLPALWIALDFSGESGGSTRRVGRHIGDITIGSDNLGGRLKISGMDMISVGLQLKGAARQGRNQLKDMLPTLAHEIGHALFKLPDRYGWVRVPARGDVVATRDAVRGDWEKFTIKWSRLEGRGAGPTLGSGYSVRLHVRHGRLKVLFPEADTGQHFLNAAYRRGWERDARSHFTIEKHPNPVRGLPIRSGDTVSLRTVDGTYVVAEDGGGREVRTNGRLPREWERFVIRREAHWGPETDDLIRPNDSVSFTTWSKRMVLSAEPDAATKEPDFLRRGWAWGANWMGTGDGAGGGFDLMDFHGRMILFCAWDRMRFGWIKPWVLTPRDRGCYRLRWSSVERDAMILWDEEHDGEYYIVENRQWDIVDQVPSSGVVISWTTIPPDYTPAVMSAARPLMVPDPRLAPLTLMPRETFGRHDPEAAFHRGEVRLPLGDGTPSNFKLSFHRALNGVMVVCIH